MILVDERGWILLQERDEHAALDPEKWGFPGGQLEAGESFEEAAYRELAEETGLFLDDGLQLVGEYTFTSPACGGEDTFALYAGATPCVDADIVCGEGRQIVFIDPRIALAMDLTASAALALPGFLTSAIYHGLCA